MSKLKFHKVIKGRINDIFLKKENLTAIVGIFFRQRKVVLVYDYDAQLFFLCHPDYAQSQIETGKKYGIAVKSNEISLFVKKVLPPETYEQLYDQFFRFCLLDGQLYSKEKIVSFDAKGNVVKNDPFIGYLAESENCPEMRKENPFDGFVEVIKKIM